MTGSAGALTGGSYLKTTRWSPPRICNAWKGKASLLLGHRQCSCLSCLSCSHLSCHEVRPAQDALDSRCMAQSLSVGDVQGAGCSLTFLEWEKGSHRDVFFLPAASEKPPPQKPTRCQPCSTSDRPGRTFQKKAFIDNDIDDTHPSF